MTRRGVGATILPIMKVVKWLAVVLVLVGIAVILRFTVLAEDPVEVRVAVVERGPVEQTVANSRAGTVEARQRARLSPQTGGLVVALPHREGSRVEEGELLLQLDDRAQAAEVELALRAVRSARSQAEEACLTAELATKELRRVEELHRQGIASEQRLDALETERDRSKAGCEAARSAVEQAEARVAATRVQLDFTELRAPFDGVVADVSTELGEWITPSPPGVPIPPVIDLLDPDSLYVSAPIDEIDSGRVEVGQPARITVDSRPDREFRGRVVRVAPYVLDQLEQNRTVEVEVAFADDEPVAGLLPGTSADVEIILDRRDDVLRVPASAVAEGERVLVLVDGVLEEREIETGLRNWEWAEVLAGLDAGDRVVVSRPTPEIVAGAEAVARDDG